MNVLLISTYELGRQPFGLASPAAWLKREGHRVICADLSRDAFPEEAARCAGMIAFYLPMHTATRVALPVIDRVRRDHPTARVCAYGLYAAMNEPLLREHGVEAVFGGEFEPALARFAGGRIASETSLERLAFIQPDRTGLPPLARYAAAIDATGAARVTGYTEATRGCKHLCRHCPIVPVYNGTFRVVQRDVVLADIRAQVAAGAAHITFGDPDFFNGPAHASALVEALHAEHPSVSYDVTIKVEHLLRHRDLLPMLHDTGCLFITSAVESVDDRILERLDKGHTRADFLAAVELLRGIGIPLSPTFVPFTPWTTLAGYRDLLRTMRDLDLIDSIAPIQFAIRLLIPTGSRILELGDVTVGAFDPKALCYPWQSADPVLDQMAPVLQRLIQIAHDRGESRRRIFSRIWEVAFSEPLPDGVPLDSRATIPYLNEPWFC